MFSTLIPCLFAAYLHGGPIVKDFDYKPVQISPSECQFTAYITDNKNLRLILTRPIIAETSDAQIRVEISMPRGDGWKRFQYWWGSDLAFIDGREVLVRHGPVGLY